MEQAKNVVQIEKVKKDKVKHSEKQKKSNIEWQQDRTKNTQNEKGVKGVSNTLLEQDKKTVEIKPNAEKMWQESFGQEHL
jgi:hypothetical protein